MRKLLLISMLTAALLAPSAAVAGDSAWSPAAALPAVSGLPNGEQSSVAGGGVIDPDGTAVAVWVAGRTVRAAARPPGGAFGESARLAGGGENETVGNVTVASTPGGDAVAVWTRLVAPAGDMTVEYSVRPSGGRFGEPRTLHTGLVFAPRVAVNARGDAVVTWVAEASPGAGDSSEPLVYAASRPAGGEFGPAQLLGRSRNNADAAVAPDGSAQVVWLEGVRKKAVRAAIRPAGASEFGTPRTLESGLDLRRPLVAAGRAGETTTVWHRRQGRERVLRYALRAPGTDRVGRARDLADAPDGRYVVAGGTGGDVAVVWADARGLNVRHRQAGRAFARTRLLARAADVSRPGAAVDPDGRLTVVWLRERRAGAADLLTASQTARGRTAGPERIAANVAFGATLATGTNGRALVTWVADPRQPPRYSVRD